MLCPISSISSTNSRRLPKPSCRYLTFPDGDITLKSSDGIEFRLDSAILRRASPFFATLQLPSPQEDTDPFPKAIEMSETASVLDDIVRSIYPVNLHLKIAQHEHAIALLRATARLQISVLPIAGALEEYVSSLNRPLRAYAIAVQFGLPAARRIAARRFIQNSEVDYFDEDIVELKYVNGRSLINLLRIRKHVLARAQLAAKELFRCWTCPDHHLSSRWRSSIRSEAVTQPFDEDIQGEEALRALMRTNYCDNCSKHFRSEELSQRRSRVRAYIECLLECAERMENEFPTPVQWVNFPFTTGKVSSTAGGKKMAKKGKGKKKQIYEGTKVILIGTAFVTHG